MNASSSSYDDFAPADQDGYTSGSYAAIRCVASFQLLVFFEINTVLCAASLSRRSFSFNGFEPRPLCSNAGNQIDPSILLEDRPRILLMGLKRYVASYLPVVVSNTFSHRACPPMLS